VITTSVVLAGAPILLVTHDEDGGWQLLCGTTSDPDDGRIVHLDHIAAMDPTLTELVDLPLAGSRTERRPTTAGSGSRTHAVRCALSGSGAAWSIACAGADADGTAACACALARRPEARKIYIDRVGAGDEAGAGDEVGAGSERGAGRRGGGW
jgi:hypothetical protein